MKIYLFHTHNGLFEGESFEEPDMIHHEEGITLISPPVYKHGQVPLFDRRKNEWTVVPLTIARQLLEGKMTVSRRADAY